MLGRICGMEQEVREHPSRLCINLHVDVLILADEGAN